MASSVENVFAAEPNAAGALFRAPLGSAAPTNATNPLAAAYIDQGYIGEDGFTESNSRDTEKKKAFGGATVKVLQTDYSATVSFTFLESTKAEVLKSVYGEDNVTIVGNDITVKKNKKKLPNAMWVIDVIDGDGSIRTFIPNGQITSVDDIVKVHTDTIAYTVTIEAFEDTAGNNTYEFINKPSTTGAPVIALLSPATAVTAGDLITVTGERFVGVTGVEVDGVPVTEYTVVNPTLLVFAAPVDTGTVPVTVINATGESAGSPMAYAP